MSGKRANADSSADAHKKPRVEDDEEYDLELFRRDALYRELKQTRRDLEREKRDKELSELSVKRLRAELGVLGEVLAVNEATASEAAQSLEAWSVAPDLLPQIREALPRLLKTIPAYKSSDEKGLGLVKQSLKIVEEERDTLLLRLEEVRAELETAQRGRDRARSGIVRKVEGGDASGPAGAADAATQTAPESTAGAKTPGDGSLATPRSAPGAAPGTATPTPGSDANPSPLLVSELAATRLELEKYRSENESLLADRARLAYALEDANARLRNLPDEAVVEAAAFRVLQAHLSVVTREKEARERDVERLSAEVAAFTAQQDAFRDGVAKEASAQLQELNARLQAREGDLTRLRNQREELKHEVVLLKGKENERGRYIGEVQSLSEARRARIDAFESEVELLRAKASGDLGADAERSGLYAEIERLSVAWARLDEQKSAEAAGLRAAEEKAARASAEKIKSDNRYFGALRQRDTVAGEKAAVQRQVDKLKQANDELLRMKKSLSALLAAAEKEVAAQQRSTRLHKEHAEKLARDQLESRVRFEELAHQVADLNRALQQKRQERDTLVSEKRRLSEELAASAKATDALRSRVDATTHSNGNGTASSSELRELKSFNDDLNKLLKCNTCSTRFKSACIDRCGHLFCKECIEARLVNRQRKCPTCGIAFGKDDVMAVYF